MALNSDPRLEIEAHLRERTGRDCVYVPSGRFGLYVALRAWLTPGDRILMSPVDDDVVLFTVLAAGLRPVMAPLSLADGNIDPDAVPDATWSSIRAVLTTNLYGLPDRLPELRAHCDALGLVLAEDAAHALHTDVDGRPVGSWGEVSVFSLSKHAAGVGGVIAFDDAARRDQLVRMRDDLVLPRSLRVRASDTLRPRAGAILERLGLRARMRARRAGERRGSHRMPLRPRELEAAVRNAPGLEPFEPWIRVDKHDYRLEQRPQALARTVEHLRSLEQDRAARVRGVERLLELGVATGALRDGEPTALFRVPLIVEDRDTAARALEAAGHPFHYVYDPPLDDYTGTAFSENSPAPEAARWWARHVLPVDPLLADPAIAALRALPDAVRSANPPDAALRPGTSPP
ncbi:MAG TPA: DegT/DnrJ/EryC1/StrS family aminotransferase [Thermoleophilaceae bacterium]